MRGGYVSELNQVGLCATEASRGHHRGTGHESSRGDDRGASFPAKQRCHLAHRVVPVHGERQHLCGALGARQRPGGAGRERLSQPLHRLRIARPIRNQEVHTYRAEATLTMQIIESNNPFYREELKRQLSMAGQAPAGGQPLGGGVR